MCGGSDPIQQLGNTLASIDPGPAIGDLGVSIDKAVNSAVPGGWITVAALTAGGLALAYAPEVMAFAEANGITPAAASTELGIPPVNAVTGEVVAPDVFAGLSANAPVDTSLSQAAAASMGAGAGATGSTASGLGSLTDPSLTTQIGAPTTSGSTFGSISAPLEGSGAIPGAGATTLPGGGLTGALPQGVMVGDGTMGTTMGVTYVDAGGGIPAMDFFGNPIQASSINFGGIPTDTSGLSLSDLNKARQAYNLAKGLTSTGAASKLSPYSTLGSGATGASSSGSSNVTNIASPKGTMVQGQQIASPLSFDISQPTVAAALTTPAFNPASEMALIQNAAQGGQIVHMDTGGLLPMNEVRMRGRQLGLAPTLSKAGLPMLGHKAGGDIEAPHNPTFFSIGGLNSLDNTYVQGEGDGTSDSVDARLADGEFVIPADVVSKLGNGSSNAGARVLDEFLVTIREHAQKHDPKDLPPNSKGPLGYLLDAKRKVDA